MCTVARQACDRRGASFTFQLLLLSAGSPLCMRGVPRGAPLLIIIVGLQVVILQHDGVAGAARAAITLRPLLVVVLILMLDVLVLACMNSS